MSAETPEIESVEDVRVQLKPFLGIAPKYYLAVIYSLLILAVLFFLLVWPGLDTPGTRVTVTSHPAGAAVTYGGKHWGVTPVTAYFPEGKADLVVGKPGFTTVTKSYSSGNNVFLSLFLPKTDSVEVKLEASSPNSVENLYRAEIGRWSMTLPFKASYQFPPLFTRFVTDAQADAWQPEDIKAFLLGVRAAVADPQMYADYGRALGLWKDAVPEGLETQYKLWEPVVGAGSGRLALWLLANQTKPVRDREAAEPSDWFKARLAELTASFRMDDVKSAAPATLKTVVGTFRGVAAAQLITGASNAAFSLPTEPPFALPLPTKTAAFWMAEAEVTQAQYFAFTQAVPEWAPAQKDALVERGLVDNDYLVSWKGGEPDAPAEPVASVSWYAAQAYIDWLNLSGKTGGKAAVLPDEYQWEAAARAGLPLLNQGVWEWTSSPWYPGQALTGEALRGASYARSIKGGVQGPKDSIKAWDRSGWPASGTTPGLGFRVALVAP